MFTTSTKLGLYPKYKPEIATDNTYDTAQTVIIGHDGSKTIAYGDPKRQCNIRIRKTYLTIILKLNTTIMFLTLKKQCLVSLELLTLIITTVNKILEDEFLRWTNPRITYPENNTFDANKKFTWNYKNFIDKLDKNLLSMRMA